MGPSLLKWLASLALGAATAALAVLSAPAAPTGVDPLVAGLAVAILSKIVNWLTAKLPTAP